MPRPFAFDKDEAWDEIIALLWRYGYDYCSVKFISEQLGITRSSFYNAFGTRDEMLREAIIRYETQSLEFAFVIASEPIDVKYLISSVVLALVDERMTDSPQKGCMSQLLLSQLAAREHEVASQLQQIQLEKTARLAEILRWGVKSKELPRYFDCQIAAQGVMALIASINHLSLFTGEAAALRQIAIDGLTALQLFSASAAEPTGVQ